MCTIPQRLIGDSIFALHRLGLEPDAPPLTLKRAFTRVPLPRPRLALLPMNTFGRADEPTIFPAHMMRLSGCSECTRTLACPYWLMNFPSSLL